MSLLTDTEKQKIRTYMGIANLNPMASSKLESSFESIDGYAVAEIREIIIEIDDIKCDIKNTRKMLGAKKTDDVEVDPVKSYIVLCAAGNAQIQIIARILGFAHVTARYFGGKSSVNTDPGYLYF